MSRFRSRFSDAERVLIVTMDLKGDPVNVIAAKFDCGENSIYQARRSSWYQLLCIALAPYIGDKRDTTVLLNQGEPAPPVAEMTAG